MSKWNEVVLKIARDFGLECDDDSVVWRDDLIGFAAAMYTKGAEDMRERAAKECERVGREDYDNMYGGPFECASCVRALPIVSRGETESPEGEQG